MKRLVLFILVLMLLVDVAEDGFLGKVKFCLPNHSAKTSVTSSHPHPSLGLTDSQHELSPADVPRSPLPGNTRLVTLHLPTTLQIMHCWHLSSSGGIPL